MISDTLSPPAMRERLTTQNEHASCSKESWARRHRAFARSAASPTSIVLFTDAAFLPGCPSFVLRVPRGPHSQGVIIMKIRSTVLLAFSSVVLALPLGCEGDKNPMTQAADKAKEGMSKAAEATKDAATKAGEAVKDATKEGVKKVEEAGSAAKKEADAAIAKSSDAAKEAVGSEMKTTMVATAQKAYDSAKSTLDTLKGKVGSLPATVKPQAEKLLGDADGMLKSADGLMSQLKGASTDKVAGISGDFMKQMDALKGKLGDLSKLIPGT